MLVCSVRIQVKMQRKAEAQPVATKSGLASLPLQFYAIGDDERLAAYVKKLNEEEREKYRKLYTRLRRLRLAPHRVRDKF